MENKKTIDVQIGICVEFKTIMIVTVSSKINPHELYDKIEYILKVENNIKDFEDFKVRMIDIDTTVAELKMGW